MLMWAVIEGAPHNVYYEAAESYNEAVGSFLEVLAREPAAV